MLFLNYNKEEEEIWAKCSNSNSNSNRKFLGKKITKYETSERLNQYHTFFFFNFFSSKITKRAQSFFLIFFLHFLRIEVGVGFREGERGPGASSRSTVEFSRSERGKPELKPKRFSLTIFIQSKCFRFLFSFKGKTN